MKSQNLALADLANKEGKSTKYHEKGASSTKVLRKYIKGENIFEY